MKRKILIILALTFLSCGIFFVQGCSSSKQENLTTYNLDLEYDSDLHLLYGSEEVVYFNNYDNMFTSLYFHLYPNAFRSDAKNKVVSSANHSSAYPNGENYGDIEIKSVKVDRSEREIVVAGEDENILEIDLNRELYPDEFVTIEIEFTVTLANINHRLGYGENTINFGNFYPVACVYESGKGFATNLYHSNGDPFYSEIAKYIVSIKYDQKFDIASSGNLSLTQDGEKMRAEITGEKIRDFAFVLSEKFDKAQAQLDNTVITYYGYQGDENLQSNLEISLKAVEYFNQLLGTYPYTSLNIVKSNFIHGGMEYPNIVLISDHINAEDYAYVIVHEIAHQWWYGLVGNDEYNSAWIDEGLAEYCTLLFFDEYDEYGFDYIEMIENATVSFRLFEKIFTDILGQVDTSMNRPLDKFNTEPEYVQCVYNKSVLMYDSIRQTVGERKFKRTLAKIVKDYSYKNISPQQLISAFCDGTGYNLEGYFNSWLEGKVII